MRRKGEITCKHVIWSPPASSGIRADSISVVWYGIMSRPPFYTLRLVSEYRWHPVHHSSYYRRGNTKPTLTPIYLHQPRCCSSCGPTAVKSQKAVSAFFTSKQMPPFGFAAHRRPTYLLCDLIITLCHVEDIFLKHVFQPISVFKINRIGLMRM